MELETRASFSNDPSTPTTLGAFIFVGHSKRAKQRKWILNVTIIRRQGVFEKVHYRDSDQPSTTLAITEWNIPNPSYFTFYAAHDRL